jgi:hypothetical protein
MCSSSSNSRRILPAAVLISALSTCALAQQNALAILTVTVGGLAKLSFSTNAISFPDADPDTTPKVPSSPPAIVITAKARATRLAVVALTVSTTDDLRAGVSTIPASEISWTASGPGFVNGTLKRAAPQMVASWSGSGVYTGTQQYAFANRWSHPTGNYSLTLTYTLSSP